MNIGMPDTAIFFVGITMWTSGVLTQPPNVSFAVRKNTRVNIGCLNHYPLNSIVIPMTICYYHREEY